MLNLLHDLLYQLPEMLKDEKPWHSLYIDYENPVVERLWREVDGNRLYLHRIYPCDSALIHPHPWPSAIKLISGEYEMGVGYSSEAGDPPLATRMKLIAGSYYEMIDPNGWHFVRPLGYIPSLSVMVTGKPYPIPHKAIKKADYKLRELTQPEYNLILGKFQARFID